MFEAVKINCKKLFLAGTVFVLLLHVAFAQEGETGSEGKTTLFSSEHESYQVLTQYYRWFVTFEREQTKARIANHMSLLSDSVLIITRNGSMKGKAGMLGFMNYVSGWKNAHHIKGTSIQAKTDGTLSLEADILYQNILPDGSRNAYALHYSTQLQRRPGELPMFTGLTLTPVSVINPPTFEDAYIENRCKALAYYWMYLADNQSKNHETMKEIIAENIQVTMKKKELSGQDDYSAWLSKSHRKYKAELRSFKNLETEIGADGSINLSMDVEWKGVNNRGATYASESHHQWVLTDNVDDAFTKIKEMKITELVPLKRLVDKMRG